MRKKKTRKEKASQKPQKPAPRGFTLIELLVVIGIIGILAAVVLVAVNPAKQFAQARNSQRQAAVAAILDAVDQNMVDNNGKFNCPTTLPTVETVISSNTNGADIWNCLVPAYLPSLPIDPSSGFFSSDTSYKTAYSISQDATTGRITVNAPVAELGQSITITR